METMHALAVINTMPSTDVEISNFIRKAKVEILSGDYNPLDIEIQLKAMEECIKRLRADEEIKAASVNEALRHSDKQFEWRGAKIQVREGGVSYDYSSTGDSEWAILKEEESQITEKRKAREKFLQSIPIEGIASSVTGEFIRPPVRTSKTTIAVTLK
jgi:hypothetical protein